MGDEAGPLSENAARCLGEIAELARESGSGTIAEIAAGLAAAVAGQPERPLTEMLGDGLQRLQEALAREEAPAVAAGSPLAQDPELLADFILESREHLATIETQLLAIEKDPRNIEPIHAVFRGFHTIKGLAGFLELGVIRELAHEVETALDLVRNGKLEMRPGVIDLVLGCADYLKTAIDGVEEALHGRTLPAPDHRALIARLRELLNGGPPAAQIPAPPPEPAQSASKKGATDAFSVRVDTAKLDYLVDMVGELVIAQSIVRHDPALATARSPRLAQNLAQLARITGEVQKTVMGVRMVAVGQLFQRTVRVIRDLARKAGKQVELELSGEDIELDKTIVEELADPLMHMVRNSIDHGIESPEERTAAGKNPAARLALRASHQSGHITIEVSDDGRGLDREKILRKAKERGLTAGGRQLSDADIHNLIFEPGFSTADQVTEISGRGVGMDVVRKQILKLRGRIEIRSAPGAGTTFLLKLPLTLAIIDGLVVVTGAQRYIVPLFAVREMLRPTAEMISTVQGRGEMAMIRGRLLPVVRLYRRFGVVPRSENPAECLLIVAESGDQPYCLMVDELAGKQEVVIKSLGETLKNIRGVAGGAILGDGRVGLILDMDGIFGARLDA
jgi:two-component system, chemotaxis family, sensor kinase CheA